jgi:hypothetical protein
MNFLLLRFRRTQEAAWKQAVPIRTTLQKGRGLG